MLVLCICAYLFVSRCLPLLFFQCKVKTGLVFKSIIQAAMPAEEKCRTDCQRDTPEGVFRFVVLYLTRFKDSIRLREGSRLEVTFVAPLLLLSVALGVYRVAVFRLEESYLLYYF